MTTAQQALTREGAFQDPTPADLSGRIIDGLSGEPLEGAQLHLDGAAAGSSAADGIFELSSVARGNHRLVISADGYGAATYSFILPSGAAPELGDLALFAETPDTAATTLTLAGLVVNGLDNRPLPSAVVTLLQTGTTVTADGQGRFLLADVASLTFDVTISASGYQARTFAIAVSGFGEVAGTFPLPPQGGDPDATMSTLRGVVRDSVSNEPLANASLRIAGTSLSTVSGADGTFELTNVGALDFTFVAALTGYSQRQYDIEIAQHGVYSIDVTLTREAGAVNDLFDIVSVVPVQTATGANTQQRFAARISNLTDQERSALIVADVLDATGRRIAGTTPFAVGTETPATLFTFAPGEALDVTIPWDTVQFAPGSYRVRVRVIEPGTVGRDLPSGVVLAQADALATVMTTQAIAGGLALHPPLAQAGSTQPVQLSALIINRGNVPLVGQTFTLSVLDPDNGALLRSAQSTVPMLAVSEHTTLDFGTWVPTRAGDLPVMVTANEAETTGIVNGVLYVGDKATGTFTLDRSVVPLGTQTVRATIDMRGVDARIATSTDPLFQAVREAVRRGGIYVGQQAPQWNEQNRCLGCHVQTQSLMGLAASRGKAEIDEAALQYLYNDIAGSQQGNGALIASHPEFSSVTNSLGVWSLSDWPDAAQAFRTVYRSASFQLSTLNTSGNQSWWSSNHCMAYWCNNEGPTMASTKGLSGALRMAGELGSSTVPDYSFEASHTLGISTLMDFEQAPNGELWYLDYDGALHAKNLDTGVSRVVASGLPNTSVGLAIRSDGVAYVAAHAAVIRINADGTRTTLVSGAGLGSLADILFGPDGFLYVADYQTHRILRVSESGAVTTFAAGGLLNSPRGMAFDDEGNLYVTNYDRFNIVRFSPTGVGEVFAPGLPYRPTWLRRGPDGAFYANHEQFNNSGRTPSGIFRIGQDGYAQRIFAFDSPNRYGYNGLNFIGDSLYVGHEGARRLYRMTAQPLAATQLDAMRAALGRVAQFTIARHGDNGQWNDIHAMRLITLAEAREHVSDVALQGQIDTAIANIATLLRARQRSDGGWAYTTGRNVSDAYTTAFVGLALEYTNPSVNDPAIRNSITYLLNQQQPDFSWLTQSGVFSTRLGPTSFVMAYLPLALDRLGGIDTDLTLVMPPNVQLANPSLTPADQSAVPGGTQYRWSLQGVTASGRMVSFDATFANLGYQEERPAAAEAWLGFRNSYTEETLRSDLAIPRVRAVSALALAVATDKSIYGAHEPVAIDSQVSNVGPPVMSGELRLLIRAGDGTVVTDLGSIAVGVATGVSVSLTTNWDTGTVLAGGYQVYGRLYNDVGVLVSEGVASFQVRHEGAATAAGVTTDRPLYQAWDTVELTGRIRNVSANVIQPASIGELQVRNPSGQVVFVRNFSVGEMNPQSLRDVSAPMSLTDAAAGEYPVQFTVRDAFSRVVLATASTHFAVERNPLQALSGRTTVQSTRVHRGTTNLCTDTVNNIGTAGMVGVALAQIVVNLSSGEVVQAVEQIFDFAGGQQQSLLRSVSTSGLPLGGYVCVLTATHAGQTRQLGSAGFEVTEPPISIASSLSTGDRGRLLILVDAPASPTDASDPFSSPDVPDLNTQRAHIESVLQATGWSYTIVDCDEDFEREFDTGGYEVYAILSEAVKLPVALQNRVVAAVHAGAGLFVSGNHDRRNSKLEIALGMKSHGRYLDVASLIVDNSEVMPPGEESVTVDARALEMRLEGAIPFARYQTATQKPNQETAAATRYAYGDGRSVYVSMDLPMAGAASGDDSLFAHLFTAALAHIHPELITAHVNRVLPLKVTLMNEGVATSGRVLLALPAGVTAVDRSGAAVLPDGTLAWEYELGVDDTTELPLWVRLPGQPGDMEFRAVIQTGVAPGYVNHDEVVFTVRITASP